MDLHTSCFCIHVKQIAPKNIHNSLLTNSALESQLPSVACLELPVEVTTSLIQPSRPYKSCGMATILLEQNEVK